MRLVAFFALAFGFAAFSHASVASADELPRRSPDAEGGAREESRAAFRRGVAAIERSDWKVARTELEHAYELFPHPSILLDLGLARARTEAWVLAESALVRFLADDSGAAADEVETARRTLVEVKSHLGTMHVEVVPASAAVTIDGERLALNVGGTSSDGTAHVASLGGSADVRLPLGEHRIHAEAPSHLAQDQTVVLPLEGAEAKLVLVPAPDETRKSPVPTVVGYSLVGVGAVMLGIGIFSGVRALDLAHQYSTPGEARYQDPDAKSAGVTFRTVADVTLLGGAALAAAGITVLIVSQSRTKPPPALAFTVAPWGGVSLRLTY